MAQAQEQRSDLAQRIKTVGSMLQGKAMLEQMRAALPRHITPERMARLALTAVRRDTKLALCSPESFCGAVIQCAQLGLEPGILGQCWILPYGREAQLIVGYRGYVALAWRSDQMASIEAHCVYKNDRFTVRYGLESTVEHIPDPEDEHRDEDLRFAYCVIKIKGGGVIFDVMSRKELEKIRALSPSWQQGQKDPRKRDSPWYLHFPEMCKKSVVRRIMKMAPLSVELAGAVDLDEKAERGESQGLARTYAEAMGTVIDADYSEPGDPGASDGPAGSLEDVLGDATSTGDEHPIEREGEEPAVDPVGAAPVAAAPAAPARVSVWDGVPDSFIKSIKNRASKARDPGRTEAEIIGRLRQQYGDLMALTRNTPKLREALTLVAEMILDT